jgi:hypothetical protein
MIIYHNEKSALPSVSWFEGPACRLKRIEKESKIGTLLIEEGR